MLITLPTKAEWRSLPWSMALLRTQVTESVINRWLFTGQTLWPVVSSDQSMVALNPRIKGVIGMAGPGYMNAEYEFNLGGLQRKKLSDSHLWGVLVYWDHMTRIAGLIQSKRRISFNQVTVGLEWLSLSKCLSLWQLRSNWYLSPWASQPVPDWALYSNTSYHSRYQPIVRDGWDIELERLTDHGGVALGGYYYWPKSDLPRFYGPQLRWTNDFWAPEGSGLSLGGQMQIRWDRLHRWQATLGFKISKQARGQGRHAYDPWTSMPVRDLDIKTDIKVKENPKLKTAKCAFITVITGDYETILRPQQTQTVKCDYIAFVDAKAKVTNQGPWEIDSSDYEHRFPYQESKSLRGSSLKYSHDYLRAKYVKTQFHKIPRLKDYDVVIYMDASLAMKSPLIAEHMIDVLGSSQGYPVALWDNWRMKPKTRFRRFYYHDHQEIVDQYQAYLDDGFKPDYFHKRYGIPIGHLGTSMVGWNNNHPKLEKLQNFWYEQILMHTPQCEYGLAYSLYKLNLPYYAFPDAVFPGVSQARNLIVTKHDHAVPLVITETN